MTRSLSVVFALLGCGGAAASSLTVTLAHGSETEARTRDQLERLVREHDVERWVYTHAVVIDDDAIPHSHPVLTLHARHLDDDDLLLSTFLHEQAHWWLEAHERETEAAVSALRSAFPALPVGFPEGASSEHSSYEHLIVDHLEHVALRCVVGDGRAAHAFAFWETDHYRALYAIEREHEPELEAIVARAGLGYRCETAAD
jgi:hypothetical protein